MGLGPGFELAELLLDDGAGPVFYSATDDGSVAPTLRGKSESNFHTRPINNGGRALLNVSIIYFL